MAKQENIELTGEVAEELGNSMFRVEAEITGSPLITCTISGKIRKNFVKVMVGDRVRLEVSPYDLSRGRITFRFPPANSKVNNPSTNNKKRKK